MRQHDPQKRCERRVSITCPEQKCNDCQCTLEPKGHNRNIFELRCEQLPSNANYDVSNCPRMQSAIVRRRAKTAADCLAWAIEMLEFHSLCILLFHPRPPNVAPTCASASPTTTPNAN
jgi:hypothetical protein